MPGHRNLPFANDDTSVEQPIHRLVAACLTTLPGTALLVLTLWALAGPHVTALGYTAAGALMFVGMLPFSLSVQQARGSDYAARMIAGRFTTFATGFLAFVFLSPAPIFGDTTAPTALLAGGFVCAIGWLLWAIVLTSSVKPQAD